MTEAHLRLPIGKIYVTETTEGISLDIRMKANFRDHTDSYEHLRKFTDERDLLNAIEQYIQFYNTRRYQKRLCCMTPMEFHAAA